jgi:hypothetical protein
MAGTTSKSRTLFLMLNYPRSVITLVYDLSAGGAWIHRGFAVASKQEPGLLPRPG